MTSNQPSFSSSRRPSSAIFIGRLPLSSPPSPDISSSPHSQLPSPPATNSGSIGDSNSTSAGSVGRKGMVNSSKRTSADEEEDHAFDNDEDATAKLSSELRPGDIRKGKEKETLSSSSAIERIRSLTERNQKLLSRTSSINSSDGSLRSSTSPFSVTRTSSIRSRSPIPPNLSSTAVASSSSRVSFAGPSSLPHGESGSETEREAWPSSQSKFSQSVDSEETGTISGPRRRHISNSDLNGVSNGRKSQPTSPAKTASNYPPNSPRKHSSTSTFTLLGTGRRSRTISIQRGDDEDEQQSSISHTSSASKRSRAPLPREFRDRGSFDGRSNEEASASSHNTQDRLSTISPNILTSRGTAVAGLASPRRPPRASTVREASRRVQRWNSVDEVSLGSPPSENMADADNGLRQRRKTGSAESPLTGKEARSVVGESLRAAGLSRRGSVDVFADGIPQRRTRLSGGLGSRPSTNGTENGDAGELRTSRASIIDSTDPTPLSAMGSRFGTTRNINTVLSNASSRAGSSLATYGRDDEQPMSGSAARTYRSSYGLTERTSSRNATPNDNSHTSTYGRSSSITQGSSPEHARLMLESLSMFEAQLTRIPISSTAPDLTRIAQSVVQSTNALNSLLRARNLHALESQIEAEVGDAPAQVDATEIWREVGAEYRETLRMSDELVRTMTQLLLGIGRLMREAVKERGTDSPDISVGAGSSRSSLDGGDRGVRAARRSTGLDGRRSAEFMAPRESRRSLDEATTSVRRSVDSIMRPSTSLSITREQKGERRSDDGDETARERDRSSALDRLTLRRMFTPKVRDAVRASPMSQDSPGLSQPSPSPAPRSYLDREREHTHSLRPLAVPPPLPSLPSESLLERKGSTRRRSKFSNTSTATVRGSSVFSPITSTNPTIALSPQVVSATGEVSAFPHQHGDLSSTLSGLQERDGRKRTLSAVSTSVDGSSGSSGVRALRSTRGRISLNEAGFDSTSPENSHTQVTGERRERRHTLTDIPS